MRDWAPSVFAFSILAATALASSGLAVAADVDRASRAWQVYATAQRAWQVDLAALLTRDRPDLADIAQLNRDLQLSLIERRSLTFEHLLRSGPGRIVIDRGASAFANFDWGEGDDARLRGADPKLRSVAERIARLRKASDGQPQWEAFRQHSRSMAGGPEYQGLFAKLQSALRKVERILAWR